MELRHLRYFVAVAEEGSLQRAAERRLHTAQPSLSRQIRDLEAEVGTPLLLRNSRGVELTAAGKTFLDHARLSIAQAQAAIASARRVALPSTPVFSVGFLTGHEADCIAPTVSILQSDLADLEVRIFSGFSINLADDLQRGRLDLAFLRPEPNDDLEYRLVLKEPIVVVLPADHRLAHGDEIDPRDLVDAPFIGISPVPRILRSVVNTYLERCGLSIAPHLEIDNFAMAISLVSSTGGWALLPASIESFLPANLVSRGLKYGQPSVDLVAGYHKANSSPVLAKFISRFEDFTRQLRAQGRSVSHAEDGSAAGREHATQRPFGAAGRSGRRGL